MSMMRGRTVSSNLNETGAFMKLFRKVQSSCHFLIAGVVQILLGIVMILCHHGITIPEDYTLDAFDVIFIFPMLAKLMYYGMLKILAEVTLVVGCIQIAVGSGCFLLGIPAIPDVVQHIRDYHKYFEKGDVPTEQELRQMLESGEITRHEYDEIHSYMDNKKS